MELPFDRFLNLVYHWATDDAEEKEKDKFDMRLNKPDKKAIETGRVVSNPASPWTKENEERALSGLVASLSGKG